MKLDPREDFVKDKGWLPNDVGEDPVDSYLGTFFVYESVTTSDKKEVVMREVAELGLSDEEMAFVMFRTQLHTKYRCIPLVTPRTLLQTGTANFAPTMLFVCSI